MMSRSLPVKVAAAENLLSQCADTYGNRARTAWTGGKDSTIVLYLWKRVLEARGLGSPKVITIDTGCKFPETVAFREWLEREWNVEVFVARPEVSVHEYSVAVNVLECCGKLKVEPLKKALLDTKCPALLTGIRRDEHLDRRTRRAREQRRDPDHILFNPLLDWTELDVWAFHDLVGLPRCSLYGRGYRSLGCMPCTEPSRCGAERNGRDGRKEQVLRTLTSLGYF